MKTATIKIIAAAVLATALLPAPSGAESNMGRIREKAEEFTEARLRAEYKHRVQGKPAELDRVYKDFAYLFSDSKIEDIISTREGSADADERRALDLLVGFIQEQMAMSTASETLDELYTLQVEEQAELPDQGTVPFTEVQSIALRDGNRRSRKFAHVTATDKLSIHNVYRLQSLATLIEAAARLGFDSYPAMRAAHQGIDYDRLQSLCEELLASTADSYEAALTRQAEKALGIERDKVRRYDLEFITTSSEMDAAVGEHNRDKLWKKLSKSLGLSTPRKVKTEVNIKADKKRAPLGDVFPFDLDKELAVGGRELAPTEGVAFDLESFGRIKRLHSLTTEQWEFTRRADGGVDRAAGYLFEGLLAEPGFATAMLGMKEEDAGELAESRRIAELVSLRLDAARFLFGLILYDDFKLAQRKFNDHMEKHLAIRFLTIDSEIFLDDFMLHSADRLAGRLLAAQMRDVLKSRFPNGWWSSREAGALLQSMWADGTRTPLDKMGESFGFSVFDGSKLVSATTSPAME